MSSCPYQIKATLVYAPLELASHLEMMMWKYLLVKDDPPPVATSSWSHLRRPVNPVLGKSIIETYIRRLVEESAEWTRRAVPTFEEAMAPFVREEWRYTAEVYEQLRTMLLDVRTDVRIFLGNDPWIMHFVETTSYDIYIQKSIDFRIADWERRMNNGDWGGNHDVSANEQSLQDEKEHRRREDEERHRRTHYPRF